MTKLKTFLTLFFAITLTHCQSKSPTADPSGSISNQGSMGAEADHTNDTGSPDSHTLKQGLETGRAYSINGNPVSIFSLLTAGLNRLPIAVSTNAVYFANLDPNSRPDFSREIKRWQVLYGDIAGKTVSRFTYDSGDSFPAGFFQEKGSPHLLIVSSSPYAKDSEYTLQRYLPATPPKALDQKQPLDPLPFDLLLELPAEKTRGTQFFPIKKRIQKTTNISFSNNGLTGLAIIEDQPFLLNRLNPLRDTSPQKKQRQKKTRTQKNSDIPKFLFTKIKVDRPELDSKQKNQLLAPIISGALFPDGSKVAWTDGQSIWLTAVNGKNPEAVSRDAVLKLRVLTIDPTGSWIIFAGGPTSSSGKISAIRRDGQCLRELVDLPGQVSEPSLSPNGQTLFFHYENGENSRISYVNFSTDLSAISSASQNCEKPLPH